jgi:hypothetical protein
MKIDFFPQDKEMFVDLSMPYEEIKFIQANIDKDDPNILWGGFMEDLIPGKPRGIAKKNINEFSGPFFPAFSNYREPRKDILSYYKLFKSIRKIADDFLLEQKRYLGKIKELEQYIVEREFTIEETQAVLKALLSDGMMYKYSKTKSDEFIGFGEHKAKYHRQLSYYISIADELKIKSKRISLLVSHGQTVGNYREVILRDLIKQHLPSKFGIATGFIQGFPNQLDIIIFDTQNYSPSFKEGDLVVIKQEAVRAIIEVKTTLNPSTLFEALEMFHQISLPGYKSTTLPIFKGIYSFESKYKSTPSVAKGIFNFYNKPFFHEQVQKQWTRDILYLYHEVTCVATYGKHCLFSKYKNANEDKNSNIIPFLFSIADEKGMDIQTAVFISLLFDYLDVEPYAKKSSVWNFPKLLSESSTLKLERKLANDDWFPRSRGQYEHNGDQVSIKRRLDMFDDWFTGKISTNELIYDQSHSKETS